jgi:hypothetical protein
MFCDLNWTFLKQVLDFTIYVPLFIFVFLKGMLSWLHTISSNEPFSLSLQIWKIRHGRDLL